uniref:NADH-ubiquinone oxidoreductase chain 4L n=1 Tax=Chironex fleckeri TaxID=45396 RepID=G9IT33_CHIFL|nr:NADH dehydrogenase subunit 4L [Chironex fleckeri]
MSFIFTVLFSIAILGIIINRASLILVLICVELMLLSISLMFAFCSHYVGEALPSFIIIVIITIAASESAIGLTLMVAYYRVSGHITVKLMNLLRG